VVQIYFNVLWALDLLLLNYVSLFDYHKNYNYKFDVFGVDFRVDGFECYQREGVMEIGCLVLVYNGVL
jgi:hypothetical protein